MKKPKKKKIAESYSLNSISPIDELLSLSDDKVSTGDEFLVDDEPQTRSSSTLLEDFDISTLVDSEIDNFSPISRDLRIDDSNIPRASNFYEFCMGEEFLNSPPYLEQALIGVRFMAEYCPRCSDLDWMSEEGHEAGDGLPAFEKHVALLENGVCPHCGATKSELIQGKELNFYNELAICAGQRCVTGDTIVYSPDGMERIGTIGKNKPYGFSSFKKPIFNGDEFEETSDFYRGKPEQLYGMQLSNGYVLRGTCDHPIWTLDGFKTLKSLTVNDVVPVYVGQDIWGSKVPSLYEVKDKAEKLFIDRYNSTANHKKHQLKNISYLTNRQIDPDLYCLLGLWIAEGRGNVISNDDPVVNDFVYNTYAKYINKRYIKKGKQGVRLIGYGGQCFLASLMGILPEDLYSGSAAKIVPDSVLQSPKEYVSAFLRGLFEGDGTCDHAEGRMIGGAGFASISKNLVYDVYSILINFGIISKIRQRMSWATNGTEKQISKPYWCLGFKGDSSKLFREHIGFMSERKRSKLDTVIARSITGNSVPNLFENLSFLKTDVYQLLQKINTELNIHYLPKNCYSDPSKRKTKRSANKLGLFTVFGRGGNEHLGSRWDKLFKESRALTKKKLKYICETCLTFKSYLSDESIFKLETYLKYSQNNVHLLKVKRCGKRKESEETFDFTLPKTHKFITQGVLSHNSGKSAVTTMIAAYVLHRFLMIGKPTELFGIRPNEILHGTFLALTLGQAKENLWDPFYGYITESPWFKNYHKFLRYYERKYGEQFLKLKDTFILYRHRNMLWYPATPDKRTLRGRTRIFGAIDELGWFDANRDSNKVKDNAHEVYKALSNSLATARQSENRLVKSGYDQALTGYMVNVSSPSSIRDKITELVRLSQGSKKLLGLHRPTWKMNPNLPFDSDIIQEEYRKDPVGAARDFGAEPSLGSHPFISNRKRIEETVREAGQNFVKYKLVTAREGVGKEATKHRTAEILGVKRDQQVSLMALDAGVVNNSFALSVGSLYEGVPVIDCLVEIIPLPGVPVSFSSVYSDVIIPLCEKRNVRILLADRWNSIKLLEDARRELVDANGEPLLQVARQYSLKYTDMYAVKDAIDLNMFKIPRCEVTDVKSILEHDPDDYPKVFEHRPVEHLLLQFATIQDAAKKMVLKGDGFTDDLWRSSALCYWGLTNPDYQEILQKKAEEAEGPKIDYAAMHLRKMSILPGGVSAGGGEKQATGSKFWGIKKSLR